MNVACMLGRAAALFSVTFPLAHDMNDNVICVISGQKLSQK